MVDGLNLGLLARGVPPFGSIIVEGEELGGAVVAPTPGETPLFLPTTVAGLQFWNRADNAALALLSDTDPISTWPDESGFGRDQIQTGSNRPLFRPGQLNGLPGVQFIAANSHFMQTASLSPLIPQPMTLFVVANTSLLNTNIIEGIDATNLAVRMVRGSGGNWAFSSGPPTTDSGFLSDSNTHIFTVFYTEPSIRSLMRLDGVNGVPNVDTGTASLEGMTLGDGIAGGGAFINGFIFEQFLYNVFLGAGTVAQLEQYLSVKWALPIG